MKAKLGKLSIGCFIVFVIFMSIFAISVSSDSDYFSPNITGIICLMAFLFSLIGFVLASIGIIKKEKPSSYCLCGFILNLPMFCFTMLIFVSAIFKLRYSLSVINH